MIASTTSVAIEAVSSSARSLYRRARLAGNDFAEVAAVVKALYTVLKHLRVEAQDPDSLLNTQQQEGSVYARQLTPIVEDTDFTLKQLDTILEKYGNHDAASDDDDYDRGGGRRRHRDPSTRYTHGHSQGHIMEGRERDMLVMIRTKLANQKTNVDIFLDTVQLHNPTKARAAIPENTDSRQLDSIKDKVDKIATRLFERRRGATTTSPTSTSSNAMGESDQEELWQQFSTELTRDGFSSDVLSRNKEVLRAYIRELDSKSLLENGPPPSVRGLLPPPPEVPGLTPTTTVTPLSYPPPATWGETSPKEAFPVFENEKFAMSVKQDRPVPPPQPDGQRYLPYRPPPLPASAPMSVPLPHGTGSQDYHLQLRPQQTALAPTLTHSPSTGLSYEPYSSDDDSDSDSNHKHELALISTRDLLAIDAREQEIIAAGMNALQLSPQPALLPPQYTVSPGASPSTRYIPIMGPDPQPRTSSAAQNALSLSPRYAPSLPPVYGSSPTDSSHPISPSSTSQPMLMPPRYAPSITSPPPAYGASPAIAPIPPPGHKLAPDAYGMVIPPDATWTKINRRLVSPEVLQRAGVRYEARPLFVAVLGVLSKADIAEYARRSAEVRSSRGRVSHNALPPAHDHRRSLPASTSYDGQRRTGSTSDDSESEELWDESDTTDDEKRRSKYHPRGDDGRKDKSFPIIVPFPEKDRDSKERGSPTSTVPSKSILKNKNENHVRFEKDGPVEVSASEAAGGRGSRSSKDRERRRERRDRDRDRDRDHDRHRNRDEDRDRERDRERRRDERRDRDRDRERDRDSRRDRDRDRRSHRDTRESRDQRITDRDDERGDRTAKKSALRETLGAVGIGGAAASLLSVLAEAAVGI